MALNEELFYMVQDDYYQARDVIRALKAEAAMSTALIGPTQSAVAASAPTCVVLDVNVVEGTTVALARMLHAQAVPFLFVTAGG